MLLDIRAREISKLRANTRSLTAAITEMEETARANERILLALHKLSLLLISKPTGWQTQITTLLKKQLSMPHCQLLVFNRKQTMLTKSAAKLPAGGKAFDKPLADTEAFRGGKRYFYLPLKKGARTIGLLIFASKKADDFPDEAARDFSRRLAELLTAAL